MRTLGFMTWPKHKHLPRPLFQIASHCRLEFQHTSSEGSIIPSFHGLSPPPLGIYIQWKQLPCCVSCVGCGGGEMIWNYSSNKMSFAGDFKRAPTPHGAFLSAPYAFLVTLFLIPDRNPRQNAIASSLLNLQSELFVAPK